MADYSELAFRQPGFSTKGGHPVCTYRGRYRNGVTIYLQIQTPHTIEWLHYQGHCYHHGEPGFDKLLAQHFGNLTCYDAGVF